MGIDTGVFFLVMTVLLAISCGASFGLAALTDHRWLLYAAGTFGTITMVVVALAAGSELSWVGGMFALIAIFTAILLRATAEKNYPLLTGESYWRRVSILVFHMSAYREATPRK